MFCGKCGQENSDDAQFCLGCGEPIKKSVDEPVYENGGYDELVYGETVYDEAVYEEKSAEINDVIVNKKRKGRWILITVIVVLTIMLAGTAALALVYGDLQNQTQEELLDLGNDYLNELDYEQSLACFNELYKIDPNNIDVYLGMAMSYENLGYYGKAEEMILKGLKVKETSELLEEYEWIQKVIAQNGYSDVKISESDKAIELGTEFSVYVLDKNGDNYFNYSIEIKGKKNSVPFGIISEDYEDEIKVKKSGAVSIELPEGKYTITVVDNSNSSNVVSKEVEISNFNQNKQMLIATDFGMDYQISTLAELTVYDVNNTIYGNYSCTIEQLNTKKSQSVTINATKAEPVVLTGLMSEGNTYRIVLSDNADTSKEKEIVVEVIGNSLNSRLDVSTNFGKNAADFDRSLLPSTVYEFNGHYYAVYQYARDAKDWTLARDYCFGRQGYLATITSPEENAFIKSMLESAGYSVASFGAYADEMNGWGWVTGEKYSYQQWYSEPYVYDGYVGVYDVYDSTWYDSYYDHPSDYFICEWGGYEAELPSGATVNRTAAMRELVLVLDASGSMDGTPMEETKKAASNFVSTVLQEDAAVGLVTFDSGAKTLSGFSSDEGNLQQLLSDVYASGGTNMEAGLAGAYNMLQVSKSGKRCIVLMGDGMPGTGKVDDELVAYADQIKSEGVIIYTIGFFSDLYSYNLVEAQSLMERIASPGCHYEVSNANELGDFFADIAEQINGTRYIHIRIDCPADVRVEFDGEKLDSDKDKTRTDFGTLTYEAQDDDEQAIKILRLKEELANQYVIEIEAREKGELDYTISFSDEDGNYTDSRTFKNIDVTKNTEIKTIAEKAELIYLEVDSDGDGKVDEKYRAGENEDGELVDYSWIYQIITIAAAVIAGIILMIVIRHFVKKFLRKMNEGKKICPMCGKVNKNTQYCKYCGSRLG